VKADSLKGSKMAGKKTCYIISQIGDPNTDVRRWANFIKDEIVAPAVTTCGYETPERSDDPHIDLIMPDIIKQMFEADLVIADLTNFNPNVFYELGIRHCAQKPAIYLINSVQSPPFDLGGNKAIFVDDKHLTVKKAISDIKERIDAITKEPKQFYSQVQQYIQYTQLDLFKKIQMSKDDVLKALVDSLMGLINIIRRQTDTLKELKDAVENPKMPSYSDITSWQLGKTLAPSYSDITSWQQLSKTLATMPPLQEEPGKTPPSKPSQEDKPKQ
jgi:nucleoside 2-deoxyribosyltransferase